MMLADVIATAIRPAYALLPERMGSASATAMLLAIGLQESRFEHREQIDGPARGFWQFELGGVRGVRRHPSSSTPLSIALQRYGLDPTTTDEQILERLAHNDTLAALFARLLLYTLPEALPGPEEPDLGWHLYVEAWRPGKPRRETWDEFYVQAWDVGDRS